MGTVSYALRIRRAVRNRHHAVKAVYDAWREGGMLDAALVEAARAADRELSAAIDERAAL